MEHDGRIPADFDWAMTRLEYEAHSRRPRLTQVQLDEARARWRSSIDRLRAIAAEEADPTRRLSRAMNELVAEYLTHYRRDEAGVLGAFTGDGTNCQGRTHLILSALSQVPGLIPPGYELGVQNFEDHVQAVLVPSDAGNHEVRDLLTNTTVATRDAPIYRPAVAVRGLLAGRRIRTGVSDEELVLRDWDAGTPRGASDLNYAMQDGQEWARGGGRYSEGPIPAEAHIPPPPVGSPAHLERTPAPVAPPVSLAVPVRAAHPEDFGPDETADLRIYGRIADPWIAEFFLVNRLELIRRNPAITVDELRWALLREFEAADWRSGLDVSSEVVTRLQILCHQLHELGGRCRDRAAVRSAVARLDAHVEELGEHPERLIPSIELSAEAIDLGRRIAAAPTAAERLRLGREMDEIWARTQRSEPNLASLGMMHAYLNAEDAGEDPLAYPFEYSDSSPLAPILDFYFDPTNVAPDRGPGGRDSEGARVRAGRRAGPAVPELSSRYVLSPGAYRELATLYVTRRTGHEEARRRAFVTSISLLERGARPDGEGLRVCGDRVLRFQGDALDILEMASALESGSPVIPCPPGSPSALTPEQEFEQLRGAYAAAYPDTPL